MALVEEVRGKVNEIFKRTKKTMKPKLLHISAATACAYRAAARLTRSTVHELSRECLDKIGHEEVGKVKWRRMSKVKKFDLIYDVVKDKTQYEERLSLSNFDTFLKSLSSAVGGAENQKNLIEQQMKVQLKKLKVSFDNNVLFADRLEKVSSCCIALGKPINHLSTKFWGLYNSCQEKAIQKFDENPANVKYLHKPMKELQCYWKGLHLKVFTLS